MLNSTKVSFDQPQPNNVFECAVNVSCGLTLPTLSPVNANQSVFTPGGREGNELCLSDERTDERDLSHLWVDNQALKTTDSMATIPGLGQFIESQVIGQDSWIHKHKIWGSVRLQLKEVCLTVT